MTWKVELKSEPPGALKYMNPILRDLGHWMHLVNENFRRPGPVQESYGAPSPLPGLRFRSLREFQSQVRPRDNNNSMESWRDMHVSHIPLNRFDMLWSVGIRSGARDYKSAGWGSSYGVDWHLGMKEVATKCKMALRRAACLFKVTHAVGCSKNCMGCKWVCVPKYRKDSRSLMFFEV